MTPKEYLSTQVAIMELGKKASTLKLDEFCELILRAETVAPMVDPTMYRKAQDNLQAIKKMAGAVMILQTAFAEMMIAVTQTIARGDMTPPPEIEP